MNDGRAVVYGKVPSRSARSTRTRTRMYGFLVSSCSAAADRYTNRGRDPHAVAAAYSIIVRP